MKEIIRGDVKMDIVLLLLEGSEPFFVIGWEMFFFTYPRRNYNQPKLYRLRITHEKSPT